MTRVERLTATILLLQEGRRNCEWLARELGVSRRTVIRDVQSLTAMGVPVLSFEGATGGYEIAREFTLAPLHLTWREALLLMLAVGGLEKMADTPFLADRASLVAKLRALMPEGQRSRVEALLSRVSLEVPERAQRARYLESLLQAVGSGAWVRIAYSESSYVLRPDRLYADRGFWYLEGIADGKSRNLRVDRISAVEACEPPERIEEPLPYGHPSHPLVRVRLTASGARIVEREPHLGKLIGGSGPTCIEFRCPPEELPWYARYFGGMGPDAQVEAPTELVDLIVERARAQLRQYQVSEESENGDRLMSPMPR